MAGQPCNVDFRGLASIDDRISAALSEASAAGSEMLKAKSLIALSIREAQCFWTMQRSTALWLSALGQNDCWQCRTIIGYEPANLENYRFQKSVEDDPDAIAFLVGQGWAQQAGAHVIPTNQWLSTYGTDSELVACFFEWVFDARKGALLDNFSLGPTQMYLAMSQPYVDAGNAKGMGYRATYPSSWDDLWLFYSTTTVSALLDQILYLDPVNAGANWPALNATDDANNLKWLTQQVGGGPSHVNPGTSPSGDGRSFVEWYYMKTAGNRDTGYSGLLERVNYIARQLGV